MDSKTKTMLGIIGVIVVVIALSENVDASETVRFSEYLGMIVQGHIELADQNDMLIQQQQTIIDKLQLTNKLLKGNSNIFVAGITDRYIPMEFVRTGQYVCYDRIQQEIVKESCGLGALTRSQFNSLTTGNPEN